MTSLHQTISVTLLVVLLPFGEMLNVKKGSKMPLNQKCTALENHEVYTSVKVAIGNPPQNFDLVADTGSDNCIVYDCSCKQCPDAWGSCFTGPARSNSFKLPMFKVRQKGSERVWDCVYCIFINNHINTTSAGALVSMSRKAKGFEILCELLP